MPPHVRRAFERSAEAITSNSNQDNTQHHHQYYYTEPQASSSPPKQQQQLQPKVSTDGYIESRKDAIHKPRAGEILVKDSVLYNNETPASSQQQKQKQLQTTQQQLQQQLQQQRLQQQQQQQQMQLMGATVRRNYWPQIDNAVTSITSKAAAAGQAVKNLLKVGFLSTFDNVNAAVEHKKHKIASYLIQAAQEHKFALQQAREQEKYKQQMKLAEATLGGGIGPAGNGVGIGAGAGALGAAGLLGSAIGGGVGIGAGPIATGVGAAVAAAVSGVTQHIPFHTNQPSLLPLAKPLHSLIPLKQQLAKNVVQHFAKHLKKAIKKPLIAPPWIVYSKTKTLPTTTVSEGYIHTFDNKYMPPNFGPPNERNPYADMGVTSYKHFEDTILRELEEKEERKVEATMHTLFDDQYVVKETSEGTKPGSSQEWTPSFNSHDANGLFVSKPITSFTQSSFDQPYLDVRPVCENPDEVSPAQPTLFVFPAHGDANELPAASNQHSVTITAADAKPAVNGTTGNSTTTEKPNYPAYFIKQQQELRKLQQKLVRSKSVYGHKVSDGTASTTVSPKATAHMKRNRGKSPYGRKSPAKTTLSSTSSTTISPTTLATPITTTTTVSPIFFFNMNGTDDGFQPMIPTEIKAMKIKKPTDLRIKLQNSGINGAIRQRSSTSSPIQAQASHVHISVVSAPDTSKSTSSSSSSRAKWASSSRHSNDMKGSSTRHAPKKALKSPTASSANATTNANQKRNRGTIKFSDSLHQSPTS